MHAEGFKFLPKEESSPAMLEQASDAFLMLYLPQHPPGMTKLFPKIHTRKMQKVGEFWVSPNLQVDWALWQTRPQGRHLL